jgi:hypothetical protein
MKSLGLVVGLLALQISSFAYAQIRYPIGCYFSNSQLGDPIPADSYAISPNSLTDSTPFLFGVRLTSSRTYENTVSRESGTNVIIIEVRETAAGLEFIPTSGCVTVPMDALPVGQYSVRYVFRTRLSPSQPYNLVGVYEDFSKFSVTAGAMRVNTLASVSSLGLSFLIAMSGFFVLRKRVKIQDPRKSKRA